MEVKTVTDGRISIHSWVDTDTVERVTTWALVDKGWNGSTLYLLNWKAIDGQRMRLTYQWSYDVFAPVYEWDGFAITVTREALPKPNKSKHWEFNRWGSYWFNKRTGERVPAYA